MARHVHVSRLADWGQFFWKLLTCGFADADLSLEHAGDAWKASDMHTTRFLAGSGKETRQKPTAAKALTALFFHSRSRSMSSPTSLCAHAHLRSVFIPASACVFLRGRPEEEDVGGGTLSERLLARLRR